MLKYYIKNKLEEIILEEKSNRKKEIFPQNFIDNLIKNLEEHDSSSLEENILKDTINFLKPPYSNLEKIVLAGILLTSTAGTQYLRNNDDVIKDKHKKVATKIINNNFNVQSSHDPQAFLDEFYREAEKIENKKQKKFSNKIVIALQELIKKGAFTVETSEYEDSIDYLASISSNFNKEMIDLEEGSLDSKTFLEWIEQFELILEDLKVDDLLETGNTDVVENILDGLDKASNKLDESNISEKEKADLEEGLEKIKELAESLQEEFNDSKSFEKEQDDDILSFLNKLEKKDDSSDNLDDYEDDDYEDDDYEDDEL